MASGSMTRGLGVRLGPPRLPPVALALHVPLHALVVGAILPGTHPTILRKGRQVMDPVRSRCLTMRLRWVRFFQPCPTVSLRSMCLFPSYLVRCRVELWSFHPSLADRYKVGICFVGPISGWSGSCLTISLWSLCSFLPIRL